MDLLYVAGTVLPCICPYLVYHWGTSSGWEYSLPALNRPNLFKAEYLWPATQLLPSRTGPQVYKWKCHHLLPGWYFMQESQQRIPFHLRGLNSSSSFGLITLILSWCLEDKYSRENIWWQLPNEVLRWKVYSKGVKKQVYWPERRHKPIYKAQKVSCAHDKTEGQKTNKNADISSTMMSGPVGVKSDRATNSRQFYPALGISCEYLEGLDLHLYARHQSNIGHFLQPRWSTWLEREQILT